MPTFFISDVHLGLGSREEEKAKENRLLSFLKCNLPAAEALFIVGDLFDFWFEYATVIPRGFHRTLAALQEYTDRGVPVHFLAGNHDFWVGDFFPTELGIQVHTEPFETIIDGKRVYMHHGDGLSGNDLGYRLIKPILRNRTCRMLYRWVHPDIGVRIARGSSRTSRTYTANKKYDEGMTRFAAEKIRTGADIVIMGHRHEPTTEVLGKGLYINLGDWITFSTFGELAGGVMTLKTWNGSQG